MRTSEGQSGFGPVERERAPNAMPCLRPRPFRRCTRLTSHDVGRKLKVRAFISVPPALFRPADVRCRDIGRRTGAVLGQRELFVSVCSRRSSSGGENKGVSEASDWSPGWTGRRTDEAGYRRRHTGHVFSRCVRRLHSVDARWRFHAAIERRLRHGWPEDRHPEIGRPQSVLPPVCAPRRQRAAPASSCTRLFRSGRQRLGNSFGDGLVEHRRDAAQHDRRLPGRL